MSEVRIKSFRGAMAEIEREREARELSVPALARMAGAALNSVYAWRANSRTPSVDALTTLAGALGYEIIMRRSAPEPEDAPGSYLARVMELRRPVKVNRQRIESLVFKPLKGKDLRELAQHQDSADEEMRVAISLSAGVPAEVVAALSPEDFARASAIIERRIFGFEG